MKYEISNTQQKVIVQASPRQPVDVIIQNLSANNVYISFDSIDSVTNNGIKLVPNAQYVNDCVKRTIYALADIDASEIRVEIQ